MKYNNKISDMIIVVGKNVKKYRIEKGMTQQELAFHCDKTDRCTISNLECFNCNGLNLRTIIKISLALNVDTYKLFIHT